VASDVNGRAAPKRTPDRLRDRLFLRLKRESRNLTQAELAMFVGVSRSAVTHWESGVNPCIEPVYAERVATVLDEPIRALFTENSHTRRK
jgi:transcriptional regulator with XRE-family HTH domain